MRNFGASCILLGILGFFYCSSQMSKHPALPEGLTIRDSLRQPAGQWQVGQYGFAILGAFGVLMAMFPKGR